MIYFFSKTLYNRKMKEISINNLENIATFLFENAVKGSFDSYELVKKKILDLDNINMGLTNIFQQELSTYINNFQCTYFLKKGVFIEFDSFVLMQKSVWVDVFKKQLLKDIKKQLGGKKLTRQMSTNFLINKIKQLSHILEYIQDKNLDRYTISFVLDKNGQSKFNKISNTAKFIFLTAIAIYSKKDEDSQSLLYEDIIQTYYSQQYLKNYEFFSSYIRQRKTEQEYKAQLEERVKFFQADENEEKMIFFLLTDVDDSMIEKGLLDKFTSSNLLPLKNSLQAMYEKIKLNASINCVDVKSKKLKI